jgi:hypothetical protein
MGFTGRVVDLLHRAALHALTIDLNASASQYSSTLVPAFRPDLCL